MNSRKRVLTKKMNIEFLRFYSNVAYFINRSIDNVIYSLIKDNKNEYRFGCLAKI